MAHMLVKIDSFIDDDMDQDENDQFKIWHLNEVTDSPRLFCNGLAYEDETKRQTKEVQRGGITCKRCLERIKEIKSIKL